MGDGLFARGCKVLSHSTSVVQRVGLLGAAEEWDCHGLGSYMLTTCCLERGMRPLDYSAVCVLFQSSDVLFTVEFMNI